MRPLHVLGVIAATVALGFAALIVARAERGDAGPPPPEQRQLVLAPIDNVDVLLRESSPPQVSVRITAGLPSGCARQDKHDWSRSGDTITITVRNSVPARDQACSAIYGQYVITVDLGSLEAGKAYTVQVNDKRATFKT